MKIGNKFASNTYQQVTVGPTVWGREVLYRSREKIKIYIRLIYRAPHKFN